MGVLKDILDTIKDVKEHIKDDENFKISNMKMKSIAKMSSDAILQFPVIVSRTLSIQDTMMASKALEREYASFVRIAVSLNSNETEYSNPDDFIKRFHSNMDDHYPLKDLMINVASDVVESSLFNESTRLLLKDKQKNFREKLNNINSLIESTTTLYTNRNIKNLISNYSTEQNKIDEVINDNGIQIVPFTQIYKYPGLLENVYKYLKENKDNNNQIYMYNSEVYIVRDNDFGTRVSSLKIMKEDTTIKVLSTPSIFTFKDVSYNDFYKNLENGNKELLREFVDFNKDCLNDKFIPKNYSIYHKLEPLDEAKKYSNPNINIEPTQVDIKNKYKHDINVTNNIQSPKRIELKDTLIDNDVKKSNELVPTLLAFRVHFKNGENVVPLDFIVGIKTVVHPVSADEIIKNLSKGLKEKNTFFNFIRWTTGEIKFLKDFILNIDGIKEDVLDKSSKGSQWWSALKRRKNVAKFKAALMMKKQILPNATIVVSTEEVSYLKNEHGIDLFNPRVVKELMEYYFLLGFVILDPSTELAYFIFDGYSGYQTFSYEALERENTNTAKEIKNIMTVLGKL